MNRLFSALLLLAVAASAADNIEVLMDNGHWKRARALAEAAYKANPNDAHANYLMARVAQRYDKLDDALKYAETAAKLDGKVSAHHRMVGEIAGAVAEKASVFKQMSMAGKIKSSFDVALALDPKNYENVLNKVQFYTEAPGIMGGDKKRAAELANDLVKSNPVHGYRVLAWIAENAKKRDEMVNMYMQAHQADPKNCEVNYTLAALYINSGTDFPKAEEHARAAMDACPDRIGGYRLVAYSLAAQKRVDESAKVVARAEAAIPDDLSPYVLAARGMLSQGIELPKAETYLKKYIAETKEPEPSAPLIAGTHWSLALVYEKEGRKSDTIAELHTSLQIKPDFEPAQNDLKRMTGK